MALITEFEMLNLIGFGNYSAQSTNSFGINDTLSINIPITQLGEMNTTIHITTGFNTYYKMQGFNSATQRYEDWHSMGSALMTPPSGNVLSNISVIASWRDR